MKFGDIIGQEEIKEHLRNFVRQGRISHAQMLSGKMGYGTLALALAYAQYIHCTDRTETDSCGVCSACIKMERLEHPDLHFVYPVNKSKHAEATGSGDTKKPVSDNLIRRWKEVVSGNDPQGYFSEQSWYEAIEMEGNLQGSISRTEAGEIIRKMSFKAFESPYKIVIIWLPERMHITAANALLKVFEEPYDKTLFLFATENEDEIIQTILSRLQTIRIPALSTEELTEYLQKTTDPGKARRVARLSMGDVLEARRLQNLDNESDEHFRLFVKLMQFSYKNNHLELIDWADEMTGYAREFQKNFIENALRLLRESYIRSIGVTEVSYLYGKELDFVKNFAPFVHHKNIEILISEFETALRHISQNGSPRIVFTHFALSLSKLIAKP